MPSEINIGGGQYIPSKYYINNTVPGSTGVGEIISISNIDPSKRVRLESLIGNGDTLEIVVDGESMIVGNVKQSLSESSLNYVVSQAGSMTNGTNSSYTQSMNVLSDIVGYSIKVFLSGSPSSSVIYFSYSEGE